MFELVSREMMIIIAVLVSLSASCYLYTEIKRQREDTNTIKAFLSRKPSRSPTNEAKKKPVEQVEEIEEEVEE